MIHILGAGGVGGGIGGLLHRAGVDVTFVARGPHLAAMRRDGLLLRTPRWQERLQVRTAERVQGPGKVLLAVKSQHTADVLDQLAGRDVLVCQNGLENEARVAQVASQVHPAMVYVAAQHLQPGVVDLHGTPHVGVIDTDDVAWAKVLSKALDCRAQPDIWAWKRAKALTNLVGALQVLDRTDQADAVMAEGARVFDAAGWACRSVDELYERVGEYDLAWIDGAARVGGSTRQDALRGRALETPHLNGHIVRLGRELGVPTPLNQRLLDDLSAR